jgi:MerR family transcriptional regulator, light-induced transcriptional regulator
MKAAPTPTQPQEGAPLRSIAEAEHETGLPRATIRMWERRYGFPAPLRDMRGERAYPTVQVEQLRQMRALIEQGWRPAALLAQGPEGISALAGRAAAAAGARTRPGTRLLRVLQSHDAAAVRRELADRLARQGLARFTSVEVPECNAVVGDAWSAGELAVHEEHLYSECVDGILRDAVAGLEPLVRPEAPRVVLTTFPQESHALGLRLAQAQLALQGCPTVYLGTRTPVDQIAAAARAYAADLVGLSFSAVHHPGHLLRGLEELRGLLPPTIRIWAGGRSPALHRRAIQGVRVVSRAGDIPPLLAEDFLLPPRPDPTAAPDA